MGSENWYIGWAISVEMSLDIPRMDVVVLVDGMG